MNIDANLVASMSLHLASGIGPRLRFALVEHFGSPQRVLQASPAQLMQVRGLGPSLVEAIVAAADSSIAIEEIQKCRKLQVELIDIADSEYPPWLREIADPPAVLYVKGDRRPIDLLAVAIVGTRHASSYGRRYAEALAAGFAQAGMTVVSGLARGIDAAAHRGALAAGGRTLAVLAGGLSEIYPPEHRELADEIAQRGALISESPLMRKPRRGSFPQRNRLISGLSLGVVVVEAAARSGALVTARHAIEQNRDVFAMPGRIDSSVSQGCHQLIRDGAKLIQCVDDVINELGPLADQVPTDDGLELRVPSELQLNELERAVLKAIDSDPTTVDQIAERSEVAVHSVLATISVLEMRHLVHRVSGDRVARAFSVRV